jgi:hypothetical protein
VPASADPKNDTDPVETGPDQSIARARAVLPVPVDEAPEDEGERDQQLEEHQLAHLGSPFG